MKNLTDRHLRAHVLQFIAGVGIIVICEVVHGQTNPEHVRSEVFIDRNDKQSITGKTEIAFAWGQLLVPPQNLIRGVINLKEAMNRWTNVNTTLNEHLLLSDPGIQEPAVRIRLHQ